MIPPFCRIPAVVLAVAAAAPPLILGHSARAQCQSAALTPAVVQEDTYFGTSGAIDGDRLIVGVPYGDVAAGQNHGAVDTFRRAPGGNGWVFDGRLTAPVPAVFSLFGMSVDVDGNFALVGESSRTLPSASHAGVAHIFVRQSNAWQHALTIEPPIGSSTNTSDSNFGQAVALDGDFALIGMPNGPIDNSHKPGKAYLYRRTFGNANWEFEGVFQPPAGSPDSLDFASAVAMQHGSTNATTLAIVGNANYSPSIALIESGQTMVYARPTSGSDWGAGVPVAANDPQAGAHFGHAVAIDGQTLIVGAPDYDGAAVDCGAVYVFTRSQLGVWMQTARIDDPRGVQGSSFGWRVSLSGDRLAVGATGRMHIYQRINGAWQYQWTMRGETTDFGERGVGISGSTAFVTSPNTPVNGMILVGRAYAFELNDANASNSCASAPIIAAGTHWGCASAATRDGRSACDMSFGGDDVWYRWVAPCDGQATINTDLSDYDTLLSVHTECPQLTGPTHQVACSAPAGTNYAAVAFDAQQGATYIIRIAGVANQIPGSYILNLSIQCDPPCDADVAPEAGGDDMVNVDDLIAVILSWGQPHGQGDVNGDSQVNVDDLIGVILAWGACP